MFPAVFFKSIGILYPAGAGTRNIDGRAEERDYEAHMAKLVSILISSFNSEKYIKEAVDSALAQTYPNLEVVVIDAASTDRTPEIMKTYSDPRVRFLEHGYEPIVKTRNELIKAAKGDYLTFLDSDDIYLPDRVAREADFLEKNAEYGAVYCDLRYFFDGHPEKLYRHQYYFPSGDLLSELLPRMFITNTTFMFRRSILEKVPGYDESLGLVEDWDFFLKLSHAGVRIAFLPEDLVRYRLRWDSHTNFAKQAAIQQSAVNIFEGLNGRMSEEERKKYDMPRWRAERKSRLAIALFSQGRKQDALREIKGAYHLSPRMLYLLIAGLVAFPAALLRFVIERAWQIKKKNLFIPV
jgi:glycosyltransferase involved in cell wall biosynthesis